MTNEFKTIDDVICAYLDKRNGLTTAARGCGYWSASSLGKCLRYQVLSRSDTVTHGLPNYAWRNAAEDGHMAHAWRQHALHNMGVLVDMEKPIIDEKLHYRGHYDMVVDLDGRLILGDIKTQNSRAFKARSKFPGRVDPMHKRQLGSYFYFLRRDVYPELKAARLYYVNKNTGEREELEVYFDETYFKEIIHELKLLNAYWDKDILPKKDVSYFCKICQFAPLCGELRNRKDTKITYAIQRSLQVQVR